MQLQTAQGQTASKSGRASKGKSFLTFSDKGRRPALPGVCGTLSKECEVLDDPNMPFVMTAYLVTCFAAALRSVSSGAAVFAADI